MKRIWLTTILERKTGVSVSIDALYRLYCRMGGIPMTRRTFGLDVRDALGVSVSRRRVLGWRIRSRYLEPRERGKRLTEALRKLGTKPGKPGESVEGAQ